MSYEMLEYYGKYLLGNFDLNRETSRFSRTKNHEETRAQDIQHAKKQARSIPLSMVDHSTHF